MKLFKKNRKGVAIVWMLIAFTVLMILAASIVYIVRQDIFETVKQEERLQTYYIALAGVDLTYAALMDPSKDFKNILQTIKNKGTPITDVIDIEVDGKERGKATVTIDRIKDDKDIQWLRITSIGQLSGKDTRVSSTMRINENNKNQIIREKVSK